MRTEVLKALIQNSTLLVVSFLMVTRVSRWNLRERNTAGILIHGLAYALCGILAIMFSVEVLPGVLIDMRIPVIVVSVLTGGPIAGAITIIPLLAYRVIVGGTGMQAGIGIIVSAFVFGVVMKKLEDRIQRNWFVLSLGIGSAVIYYVWIMTLPGGIALEVLRRTFIPLTVSSLLTIFIIFIIRNRDSIHAEALSRLREANDLFEEIALDENIGITVLHGEKLVFVNRSLLLKFGYSYFDPENSSILEIVSPETRRRIESYLDRMGTRKEPGAFPMKITIPGRGTLHFLVHARKLVYRGMDCVLVVSVDISRLIDAEETLQRRVDQLQLSLEASGAVLWKVYPSTDIIEAGEDFYELLDYSPEENPPLFSHLMLAMETTSEMELSFRKLLEGSADKAFGEFSIRGSDGSRRWFNTGARLTCEGVSGDPMEITGILYETTPIKERELELMQREIENLQSQKMESIGRLAGGVAHDFNNLLHVIMGYTEILKKVSENDPVTEELSQPIMEASEKGRQLVRQLLLFSRDKIPELSLLDLKSIVGDFVRLLQRILEENILISTEITDDVLPVLGDRGQIEQVLMNLCLNSRDAMPEGGVISIELRSRTVTNFSRMLCGRLKPGEYTVLSVRDTGPGIPPENHRLIFEPFYTTKQVDKGTGLGLSTVMGVMESHDGAISADNPPEGGFLIDLYFPGRSVTVPVKPDESEHEPVRSPGSITVLVAEDDPQVRNLTVEGLGASGIRVLKAADGREAVKVYREHENSIDLLVFDVVMPFMNGPEAYWEITSSGSDVPVIFTTGYAGDRLSGIPGTHVVVSKPYAISELLTRITEVLTGERRS